ncbi:MAG: GGDEF domain-containing protein [Chloroflexi bacterium]|nr:GGDEF domain-containing protein [Chloroflexota bacterium]
MRTDGIIALFSRWFDQDFDPDVRRLITAEEAGRERRANHLRLATLALFLLLFAIFYLKSERHYVAGYLILFDFIALLVYALCLEWWLRKGNYHRAVSYVSFGADLTCISMIVVSSLFLSQGPDPSGWITSIGVYFLFVALTGLRFSPYLCLFMGLLAAIEFLLVNEVAQVLGGQSLPLLQKATISVLMIASGFVLAVAVDNARRLVVRIGLAERERARLENITEATRRLAITDDLTGLANRRHFQDELQRQLLHPERKSPTMTVLMIDVDDFKDINDRLGHQVGDEVMRQIAAVLVQCIRSSDLVARVGGDEFGVLLYEADATQAQILAERLCEAVRRHTFETVGGPIRVRTSVSVGLASLPRDGRDIDALLAAADKALYVAKSFGKNQVKCAV